MFPLFFSAHRNGGAIRTARAMEGPRRAAPLRVGLLIPVSGSAGIWGPSAETCARLAVEEINERGGLLGRRIELVIRDAGGVPKTVAAAARARGPRPSGPALCP